MFESTTPDEPPRLPASPSASPRSDQARLRPRPGTSGRSTTAAISRRRTARLRHRCAPGTSGRRSTAATTRRRTARLISSRGTARLRHRPDPPARLRHHPRLDPTRLRHRPVWPRLGCAIAAGSSFATGSSTRRGRYRLPQTAVRRGSGQVQEDSLPCCNDLAASIPSRYRRLPRTEIVLRRTRQARQARTPYALTCCASKREC